MASASNLKKRLLQDIAELQTKPYPNITLHVQDSDVTQSCLILEPEGYGSMHLTVFFPDDYPLRAPTIQMNSDVSHPNIFGSYICASILNTREGYTPAYTLKGIAIQLLSFFGSSRIEQTGGLYSIELDRYRDMNSHTLGTHLCTKCGYGTKDYEAGNSLARPASPVESNPSMSGQDLETDWPSPQQATQILGRNARRRRAKENAAKRAQTSPTSNPDSNSGATPPSNLTPAESKNIVDMKLPSEILLIICEKLETEDLMIFAQAWEKVGRVMTQFDVIRTRELQCFCFKKDYRFTNLGIGVSIEQRGKIGTLESEFDLLSWEGFATHRIRRSVQGVSFTHWLPLPISQGHWNKVRLDVDTYLTKVAMSANMGNVKPVQVIYHFMNDVVVKLNDQASKSVDQPTSYHRQDTVKSTLTHASEKAIESYFHLFHLLLCLATSDPSIQRDADNTLKAFARGENSKTSCPNLGHLLVASLISTVPMDDRMMQSIIKETITRNVVWMFESRGANMPELSYLEPSPVSEYRLQKTFDASKTSYRLLMFLNLFRTTAVGSPRLPLHEVRDQAFDRHGAPPRGSAKGLAESIKRIHQVKNFPEFLACMGIGKPSAAWFTNFLRETVRSSEVKGYHKQALTQGEALWLRREKGESAVEAAEGVVPQRGIDWPKISFFPARGGTAGGGRGRGRGRGGNSRGRGGW